MEWGEGVVVRETERDFLPSPVVTGQGNVSYLKEDRFRLNIRKSFFAMRMRHWHGLPREVVIVPSLGSQVCLIPSVQDQAGWGLEQSGPVKYVLAHGKGAGIR